MHIGAKLGLMSSSKDFPKVESTSTNIANSSSITVNFPSGYQPGDLILIIIALGGGTTFNTPSGWSIATYNSWGGTIGDFRCYYKVLDGTEGSTVNISVNVSTRIVYTAYRISGAISVEGSSTSSNSSSSINSPSHTASWGIDKNLWVAACAEYSYSTVITAPTNYNNNFVSNVYTTSGAIDNPLVASGVYNYEGNTQDPSTFGGTLSGGFAWCAATLVVKPK